MGPSCFENTCRNKRAKHHNFEGRFALEKHGRVFDAIAEEHDVQLMRQVQQAADDEDEIQVVDSNTDTCSSEEETDSESQVEIVMSAKEEDIVRKHVPLTSENLAALLLSLQGGDGNPPSVSTTDVQTAATTPQVEARIEASDDDTEESDKNK
ncbi:hypothetical protein Hanom_Chr03g00219171 [Helianthus anomalus]